VPFLTIDWQHRFADVKGMTPSLVHLVDDPPDGSEMLVPDNCSVSVTVAATVPLADNQMATPRSK
jgi:hypothetical protein